MINMSVNCGIGELTNLWNSSHLRCLSLLGKMMSSQIQTEHVKVNATEYIGMEKGRNKTAPDNNHTTMNELKTWKHHFTGSPKPKANPE